MIDFIKWFLGFFISSSAGYFGSFLSGITIFIIFLQYRKYKKNRETEDYGTKLSRTFEYINRLKEYYNEFYFYNITEYVDNITNRKSLEELRTINRKLNYSEVAGSGAEEFVKRDLMEVYTFLKEVSYVLKRNQQYDLVAKDLLDEYFKSFDIQIKNFFIAANLMLKVKEHKFGNSNVAGWGDIDSDSLQELQNVLSKEFSFLK